MATKGRGNLTAGPWAVGASISGDPAGSTVNRRVNWKTRLAHHWHLARSVRCARVLSSNGLDVDALGGGPFRDDVDAVHHLDRWALSGYGGWYRDDLICGRHGARARRKQ